MVEPLVLSLVPEPVVLLLVVELLVLLPLLPVPELLADWPSQLTPLPVTSSV